MKKIFLVTLMILAVAAFAAAQIGPPTSDVLGATHHTTAQWVTAMTSPAT